MSSDTNIATYRLEIIGPDSPEGASPFHNTQSDQRVLANVPAMLEAVEEDLTKLLPEGYRAEIKEER